MTQVMLVLKDPALSKVIHKLLAERYKIEVHEKEDSVDAVSFLEIIHHFNLILCSENINKDQTYKKIAQFINKNKESYSLQILVISEQIENLEAEHPIIKSDNSASFFTDFIAYKLNLISLAPNKEDKKEPKINVALAAEKIKESKKEDEEKTTIFIAPQLEKLKEEKQEIYLELDLRLLKTKNDYLINSNLYVRIKKGDRFEYTQKFNSGSTVNQLEIEKHSNRGIKQFWIKEEDYQQTIAQILKNYAQFVLDSNQDINHRFQCNSDIYEIILKMIKEERLDQGLVDLIKIALMSYDLFLKLPDNFKLLNQHFRAKNYNYGIVSSKLTCLLLYRLCPKFEWSKDFTLNKLNYLTYFHDLGLEHERLIKKHYNYPALSTEFSAEEASLIENHADYIAKTLEKIVKAPKELVAYIREHHGSINGKGVPEALNTRIYPLSKALIVTETFSFHFFSFYENNPDKTLDKVELEKIFEHLKTKFEKPVYSDILQELKKIFETEFQG